MTTASAAEFLFRPFRRHSRPASHDVARTRVRLARFAWAMDSAFRVPGTNVRIGIEPILGFVPGIGDVVGKGLSLYLVHQAWRLGAPVPLLLRMLGNIAVDAAIGSVPIVGDIGDVFWRANRRNLALLDGHLARQGSAGPVVIEGEWRRLD